MFAISDEAFDALVTRAMDELPQHYITNLDNVAILYADEPTPEQLEKMKIDHDHVLLGLYEGIPLPQRGSGWSGMLPDRITLFKGSILRIVHDEAELFEQVKRTLWHEIAHYYGLTHDDMDALIEKKRSTPKP